MLDGAEEISPKSVKIMRQYRGTLYLIIKVLTE